ncbi:hypothetical protein WMF45_42935 [Sorangium sp. So ce448]|uniref:hypothetical protein n=1 Tax=Sorangium sp. So ce448 TaxID=3133314 RepID=UPI003F6087D3
MVQDWAGRPLFSTARVCVNRSVGEHFPTSIFLDSWPSIESFGSQPAQFSPVQPTDKLTTANAVASILNAGSWCRMAPA